MDRRQLVTQFATTMFELFQKRNELRRKKRLVNPNILEEVDIMICSIAEQMKINDISEGEILMEIDFLFSENRSAVTH